MTINFVYSEKMKKTIHEVCPAPDYVERNKKSMRNWVDKIRDITNKTGMIYLSSSNTNDDAVSATVNLINKNPDKSVIFECEYFERSFYAMANSEEEICNMIKVASVMDS